MGDIVKELFGGSDSGGRDDSPSLIECAYEAFEEAVRLSKEGERRFKATPWEHDKLLWTQVRRLVSVASENLEQHAKNRFEEVDT